MENTTLTKPKQATTTAPQTTHYPCGHASPEWFYQCCCCDNTCASKTTARPAKE